MNTELIRVTERIVERSRASRQLYLTRMKDAGDNIPDRKQLSCGNLAHGSAACNETEKNTIKMMNAANLGIVTAYNDMLSAHHPYERFPGIIKAAARDMGCTAQVAGGTPAMCDGRSMLRARLGAMRCCKPNRIPITARAPVPFTAPPTPTRC